MNLPTINPDWLAGITMTSEQKAKWLGALRGGQYDQGRNGLFDPNRGHCCLGVYASAVHGAADDDMEDCADLSDLNFDGDLGPWSDNFDRTDQSTWTTIQSVLAGLNDCGWSFAQIADFIEQNIPACDEARS